MEKLTPELELEGWVGFPQAEMGWYRQLQFALLIQVILIITL